jgi:23S rRNA pseudouridine2605 synthase
MKIRLQRFLAQAGVASRRAAEALITAGKIRVNGAVVTTLGTQVEPESDRVEVDGKRVRAEMRRYLLLYKPVSVVTTLDDPEGRPTVAELLPRSGPRLYPVGRLDVMSEGALLCTNDGELAHALTHPKFRVPKRYLVRVRGKVDEMQLQRLTQGIDLEDGPASVNQVLVRSETASHTWLDLTVTEGRNRLVRRLCEALDLPVMRLIRTSFATLDVEEMHPGDLRELSAQEIHGLRQLVGLHPVKASAKEQPLAARPDRGGGRKPAGPPSPQGGRRERRRTPRA